MLTWYENIYVGNNAKKKEAKIRKKLDQGKLAAGIFLITLPVNPDNNLEIIGSVYLKQESLYRKCPMVVGLANGYEEALLLVQQITEDVFRQTGDTKIREYFLDR